jgi:hypothetical protein
MALVNLWSQSRHRIGKKPNALPTRSKKDWDKEARTLLELHAGHLIGSIGTG